MADFGRSDHFDLAYPRPELLATPEWLQANLGRPGFAVLDLRWRPDGSGRRIYASGHIPGATYVDWQTDLVEEDEGTALLLAGSERVTATLARAGIGNGTAVVLYDDTGLGYAALAWWALRAFGCEPARIMMGGMAAWEVRGLPISRAVESRPPTIFRPRPSPRSRVDAGELRQLIGSGDAQILDSRSGPEYGGQIGTGRRLGHVPGAINVPVASMTEPGTATFKPAEELKLALRRAGVSPRKRLVCYDTTILGASELAFILALLGHEDVAVYEGGWTEWADRLDLPVES